MVKEKIGKIFVDVTHTVYFLIRQLNFGIEGTETATSISSNKKFQNQPLVTTKLLKLIWILKAGISLKYSLFVAC